MPFVRYARDKRGYESTFIMHAYRAGQGNARARVLYMFRSPSNTQIGRKPLDPEVREALEHTHPDLNFDWVGLLREPMPPPPKIDPRERGPRQRAARAEKASRSAAQAPAVLDDDSLLARVVGATEATRLRARFAELNHRIARRARTPEDRERLLEAARETNPDTWADEAAIRAALPGAEARWDAIVGELPKRRRGRRGGKAREGETPTPDQLASGDVIIGERDDSDERNTSDPIQDSAAVADNDGAAGLGDAERAAARPDAADSADPAADVRRRS